MDGNDGGDGLQCPPGEFTSADLAGAISSTSSNSTAVLTLDIPFADPDDEALRVKINELITALRR